MIKAHGSQHETNLGLISHFTSVFFTFIQSTPYSAEHLVLSTGKIILREQRIFSIAFSFSRPLGAFDSPNNFSSFRNILPYHGLKHNLDLSHLQICIYKQSSTSKEYMLMYLCYHLKLCQNLN